MNNFPRISIVTSSYNQGAFIERTIQSVIAQHYPNVEHIIVDGMSSDNTLEVLSRYPHLKIIREPDKGQADAINKGFAIATGEILCFLNSDDTFEPGTLMRVAQEIDPSKGRHIVMGRCRFIDEQDQFIGIEHPSYFENHARVLKIWNGYGIPQPSVFWSREVLNRCGGLDINEHMALDYDLFCRFSKFYNFYCIDQIFSNYRLHSHSKTNSMDDDQRSEYAFRVSKRYWGSPFTLFYFQQWVSYLWYRFDRAHRCHKALKNAYENGKKRQLFRALIYSFTGCILGPDIVFYRAIFPWLKDYIKLKPKEFSHDLEDLRKNHPKIAAYLDHTKKWPDGWTGPRFVTQLNIATKANSIKIKGHAILTYLSSPLNITLHINGTLIKSCQIHENNEFELHFDLTEPLPPGNHEIEIETNKWFVMHDYYCNRDYRPLSWKVVSIHAFNHSDLVGNYV